VSFIFIEKVKKNWLFAVGGVVIGVLLFFLNNKNHEDPVSEVPAALSTTDVEEEQDSDTETIVIVDVKGEVKNPGVYEVDPGARIHDVIELAGDFTEEADETSVNLAEVVHDERMIVVPKIGDETNVTEQGGEQATTIKINQATQAEIEQLPGIGPSKAATIIKHREEHGPFKELEDLLDISGIGEKTLENMADEIQIP